MKNEEFNIEKNTMRELTSQELNDVAGGTSPVLTSSAPCLRTIHLTIRITIKLTEDDPN